MVNTIVNIVICYENEDEIISYAKELTKQTVKVALVVVVNKIGNRGIEFLNQNLRKLNIQFEIHDPGENKGYLNGLTFGFKETNMQSEWYALTNTDIEIKSSCFFEKFITNESVSDKKVWLIGPSVFVPKSNRYSNPYIINRPSKISFIIRIFAMRFYKIFNLLHELKLKFKKNRSDVLKCESALVYAVHGSYMFARKEFLEVLVKQPAWELLYAEEQYLAELVVKNGCAVFYNSEIEVNHLEGTSTGKINLKNKYQLMIKANKRLIKEFY